MNVKVFSRKTVSTASSMEKRNHIVITISDRDKENLYLPISGTCKAVLPLKFDDTDSCGQNRNPMFVSDAQKIARFVNLWKNGVDTIIVNCEAGQSRSAGVAAAILKYFNGDDWQIFDNKRYTPNMRCYRLVLQALYDLN